MSYTSEDLKKIRKAAKLSQEEFASKLQLTREMVSNMETGKNPLGKATQLLLEKFESEFISQKETIKQPSFSRNKKEVIPLGKHAPLRITSDQYSAAFGDWKGLPMYNTPVTASFIQSYRDEQSFIPQYYLHDPRFRDCDFGAIITGDSMHDEIRHGDFIACKEIHDKSFIVFGDIYYIVAKNGLETCKYINADKNDSENLLLVAKNTLISPSPIKKKMIDKIYKVRGIVRGY